MLTWKAHPGQVNGLAFSPDGRRLATTGDEDVAARLWDAATGAAVAEFGTSRCHLVQQSAGAPAFSPCGRWLAALHREYLDSSLRVWDVAAGTAAATLSGKGWGAMAFLPGDPPALLHADSNRLRWYTDPFATHADALVLNRGPDRKLPKASRVVVSPDGARVATNGRPKCVVWDAATKKPLLVRDHPKSPNNGPVAFSPDGTMLAVGHGTKVDLWRYGDPDAEAVELAGHKRPVWGVGFSPDGATVYTVGSDGTARTWDAPTGRPRGSFDWGVGKLYAAAFAPDGLTCAAGTEDGRIVVWDVDG